MKVKFRKKSVSILRNKIAIPFLGIWAIYTVLASVLILSFPFMAPYLVLSGVVLLIFKKKISLHIPAKKVDISPRGISISHTYKKEQFIRAENILTIYIQNDAGRLEVFINSKEEPSFFLIKKHNAHTFVQKMKSLLNMDISNVKKTPTGNIYKLNSKKSLKSNHNLSDLKHKEKQSEIKNTSLYFEAIQGTENFIVKNQDIVGELIQNKLEIDKGSQTLKIRLSQSVPDEISIHDIVDIKTTIHQVSTGAPYDPITGKIIVTTHSGNEITIFRCSTVEAHQFDFTADELEEELSRLRAMIDFEILSIIDSNTSNLDLESLEQNLKRQKETLPNKDLNH